MENTRGFPCHEYFLCLYGSEFDKTSEALGCVWEVVLFRCRKFFGEKVPSLPCMHLAWRASPRVTYSFSIFGISAERIAKNFHASHLGYKKGAVPPL